MFHDSDKAWRRWWLACLCWWVSLPVLSCLAQEASPGQWILVSSSELRDVAQPLIEQRQQQQWQVVWIDVSTLSIADGQTGPVADSPAEAIAADQVGKALQEALAQKVQAFSGKTCVLLLGTWETEHAGSQITSLRGATGRMLGRETDHGYGLPDEEGSVSVAVGRLPARDVADAEKMIDKLLAFESAQFEANDVNLLVAHPGGGSELERSIAEHVVMVAVDQRLKKLSEGWEASCVTDIANTDHSVAAEAFGESIQQKLSAGYLFSVFCGHSNAAAIYSQAGAVFDREDFESVKSKQRGGVFISCGCYGCEIQGPFGQGYGIAAVRSSDGPAAVIGAVGESYSAHGLLAFDGLLSQMTLEAPPALLGDYWMAIQHGITCGEISPADFMLHDMADGSRGETSLEQQRLEHAEMWILLGDPAMRLPYAADD